MARKKHSQEGKDSKSTMVRAMLFSTIAIVLLSAFLIFRPNRSTDTPPLSPPDLKTDGATQIDPAIVETIRTARNTVLESPDSKDAWSKLGSLAMLRMRRQ